MSSVESDEYDKEEYDKIGYGSWSDGMFSTGLGGFLCGVGFPLGVRLSADESFSGDGGSLASI